MPYEVTGIKMNDEGKCLVDMDGHMHAVKNLLPGETVKVAFKDNTLKVIKYIKPDDRRQKPPCPIFEECGGCQLQMMDDEQQLIYKQHIIESKLQAADMTDIVVLPTIGMK